MVALLWFGCRQSATEDSPKMPEGSGFSPKRGKRRAREFPKGRQLDPTAVAELRALLGTGPLVRDRLIEYLHLIQDWTGHLSARHLCAMAEEMRIPMAEVYEAATFYAHFDVVKEGETPPPPVTIRVCNSLSCEMAGAEQLYNVLKAGIDPQAVRVVHAPCMGLCDKAPAVAVNHNYMGGATAESAIRAVEERRFETTAVPHVTLDERSEEHTS